MKKIEWLKFFATVAITLGLMISIAPESYAGEKENLKKTKVLVEFAEAKADGDKGGFIGIYPAEIGDNTREALDFKGDGILVHEIVEGGPAEKAGLEAGDIIVELGGKKLKSMKDLRKVLSKHDPNSKIKVLVMRDGEKEKFKVKLGERPSAFYGKFNL